MNSDQANPTEDDMNVEGSRPGDDDLDATRMLSGDTASDKGGAFANPDFWVGRRLGKYEVTELLGVGGMGVVLKAHDTSIERDVAIKVLPTEFSDDENALGRFLAEAKSAGQLNHANTVTIYEIAQDDDTHYLVMEFIAGGSVLDRLNRQGAFSVAAATRLTIEACTGLAAAHTAGLVHRDIKPANLLLADNGSVKVSDFGLAKRTHSSTLQLTQDGQMVGTPYFMSPEQCESKNVDARSDVYSLGATYFSLLTGQNPYEDKGSVVQVMFAHCNAEPPDPREVNSHVPPACALIIERAMAKNPEQRYQSTEEMRVDLEAVLAALSGAGILLPSQSSANLPPLSRMLPNKNRRPKSPAIPIAAMIAVALAIAAFFVIRGSNDNGVGDTGKGESAANAIAVPPTGDSIKVGILHSLTGTMASSESPVVDAALLAIDEINQSGGLLGRPVEAIVVDGRSDSASFAAEARRLIEQQKVSTVFGCWTSASRKTVVPIFEELNHLLIYPVQYEGVEESPNVIYTGAAPNQQIIPAVKWAYAFENKRKFFLVGSDYVFPRVAHEIIKDQLEVLGAEIVGERFLPLGSVDVKSVIESITAAKPDVILNSINGGTNTAFFTELRQAGITPQDVPTISFSIGEAELQQMDVSTMTGDYAAWNYFQSIESPENQKFVSRVREKYGDDRVITDPMEAAWFGVQLWAQAVTEADSIETTEIRRAIRNQRTQSANGEVRIDPATQHTFKTPRIGRVQSDGQFEIVWTAAKPEMPNPYPSSRTSEQWRALLHDLFTGWDNKWSAPPQ